MNLKSYTFLVALNNIANHLIKLGFSVKYSENQNRYSKKNRQESINTLGMSVTVYENEHNEQIALTLSDDRQLPLRIDAGFSLANNVFIPVVQLAINTLEKDYKNQVVILSKIEFDTFADMIKALFEKFDSVIIYLDSLKEIEVQSLINQVIEYRNTFSSTSQLQHLQWLGRSEASTALQALKIAFNSLFNSIEVADRGLLLRANGQGIKTVISKQLRYKHKLVSYLLDQLC